MRAPTTSHQQSSQQSRTVNYIVSRDSFLETVTPYVFHGLKKKKDLVSWQRRSLSYIPTDT